MVIPPAATACQLWAGVPGTHVAAVSWTVGTRQLTSPTSVDALFLLADAGQALGVHGSIARALVAVGEKDVGDLAPLPGELGHGTAGAKLGVVGVRVDGQRAGRGDHRDRRTRISSKRRAEQRKLPDQREHGR